jgi:hypothetical protein
MDESQPLLGPPLLRQISEVRPPTVNDPEVDFDPFYDPDNPLDWKKGYKMAVVALLALMAGTVYDDEQENNPLVFKESLTWDLGRLHALASYQLPTELYSI